MMNCLSIQRMLILVLCLAFLLSISGCMKERETPAAQSSHQEPADDQSEPIDSIQIIEDTPYFRITEENGLFAYEIYSESGDLVKFEDRLTSQPRISLLENHLIEVMIQAGTGIGTQSGFYYDCVHDRFSDVYQSILDQQGDYVAYATERSVIVRNIFGNEEFGVTISSFSNSFSNVAFPFVSAAFSDDGSQICVTYLTGENCEEVSETFETGRLNHS